MGISTRFRIVSLATLASWPSAHGATLAAKDAVSSPRPAVSHAAMPVGQSIVEKLDHPQLRFRVAEAVGEIFICGPFRVTREVHEREVAAFAEIQRDMEFLDWIKHRLGLTGKVELSDQEKASIYQQYRRLQSVVLEKSANAYSFRVRAMDRAHPVKRTSLFLVSGLFDGDGKVSVQRRDPVFYHHCAK